MMQVDDGAGLMSFVVDVGTTRTRDVDGDFKEDDDLLKVDISLIDCLRTADVRVTTGVRP